MRPDTLTSIPGVSNDHVEAFRSAWERGLDVEITDFLPSRDSVDYARILRELVRLDMAYRWCKGQRRRLAAYEQQFPELLSDPETLQVVALEEYCCRARAGDRPDPGEYRRQYRVCVDSWPSLTGSRETDHELDLAKTVVIARNAGLERAAAAYREFRLRCAEGEAESMWEAAFQDQGEQGEVFREIHRVDPEAALRLAQALTTLPEPPCEFMRFRLIEELGRGKFGRAYLAQQEDLASRYVVLKVSTDVFGESQALARLQHTNVVPIYSIHRQPPYQAVCMPYYGSTTLADLLQAVQRELPSSGKTLLSTIQQRKSRGLAEDLGYVETLPSAETPTAGRPAAEPAPGAAAWSSQLRLFENMSHIEAVLWMASRLADGLNHAHERGILHRDLKPANILLTDEGQPMLLDFNLCEDAKLSNNPAAAFVGGTLPYMAPEQLAALRDPDQVVDARSDLYALGVILYELLAGRSPFPTRKGPIRDVIHGMIQDRGHLPPRIREFNKEITPAAEAIVLRCLAPEPSRRYQTARELKEDLDRQLEHRPLRYARDRSPRERLRKWSRRNPYWSSPLAVMTLAAMLIVGLSVSFALYHQRLERLKAQAARLQFQKDKNAAQFLLTGPAPSRQQLEKGIAQAQAALFRYGVLAKPNWQSAAPVADLPAEEREQLLAEIDDLLLLLARGIALRGEQAGENTAAEIRQALLVNEHASPTGRQAGPRTAAWDQREDLNRRLTGDRNGLRAARDQVPEPDTARECYQRAADLVAQGAFPQAFPLLRKATRLDPQHFWAWFLLGYCHDYFAQTDQAAGCYSTCIALQPDSPYAYYNRGLAYYRGGQPQEARADFDMAIELLPTMAEAYLNRALARNQLKDHQGCIDDLNLALENGSSETRIYFLRARARELIGDQAGARKDREIGLEREPEDDKSYVARGLAVLSANPEAALADFEKATQLCSRSLPALENQAHVLSERLGRPEDSIRILTRVLELYPDRTAARSSRGVLYARLGNRTAALQDAEESLRRDTRPPTLYQVAGIYALTSQTVPDDRLESFRLLSSALRMGYGFDLLEKDGDLDPIRAQPEFHRLVEAAKSLQTTNKAKSK